MVRDALYTGAMADEATSPTCPMCGGTGWALTESDGVELVRRCGCDVERRRAEQLAAAGIPERYRHCTLESFELWNKAKDPSLGRAKKAVQEFVDLYPQVDRGLLLMGGVGTGKTHLAVAALTGLIRDKGVRGRFADFTSLVLEIQMTFDVPGGSRNLLRPLVEAELLVLDELGAGKTSAWVTDLLYYLVNTRYLEGRLTIFTTNFLDPPDVPRPQEEYLADRISRRIRSRLFEMCRSVSLTGDDYRKRQWATRTERNA